MADDPLRAPQAPALSAPDAPPSVALTPAASGTVSDHLGKWRRFAPAGLVAVGLGLSVVGEATLRKGRGDGWVALGTAGLCVVNAGLCLFGEAVKHRALADWRMESGGERRVASRR